MIILPIDELHHFSRWFLHHQPTFRVHSVESVESPSPWPYGDRYVVNHFLNIVGTGWCPPVINWFIYPIDYSYICHKP